MCSWIDGVMPHYNSNGRRCCSVILLTDFSALTIQKTKFSIKHFVSKCDQIGIFLRIWSHLLKISLMENFIFCVLSHPGCSHFAIFPKIYFCYDSEFPLHLFLFIALYDNHFWCISRNEVRYSFLRLFHTTFLHLCIYFLSLSQIFVFIIWRIFLRN